MAGTRTIPAMQERPNARMLDALTALNTTDGANALGLIGSDRLARRWTLA